MSHMALEHPKTGHTVYSADPNPSSTQLPDLLGHQSWNRWEVTLCIMRRQLLGRLCPWQAWSPALRTSKAMPGHSFGLALSKPPPTAELPVSASWAGNQPSPAQWPLLPRYSLPTSLKGVFQAGLLLKKHPSALPGHGLHAGDISGGANLQE